MAKLFRSGAITAVLVAILASVGVIATWAANDTAPAAGAWLPPSQAMNAPMTQVPNKIRRDVKPAPPPPAPFASDDRGFIASSARCEGTQSAFAIGRTEGSLVVICGAHTGQYEYLGVRLSDAALLRTTAETDARRGFVAQRAGVSYAVSPAELKVTSGRTVIKREKMIEYREFRR